ncbi:MAG: CPCC family cysteine-rich protein [Bdellovibrionia bacterium]
MKNSNKRNRGFPCPCCEYLTRSTEVAGTHEICPICRWEDDFGQFKDPRLDGGANDMSLEEARGNFIKYGAKSQEDKLKVRAPLADEYPLKLLKR